MVCIQTYWGLAALQAVFYLYLAESNSGTLLVLVLTQVAKGTLLENLNFLHVLACRICVGQNLTNFQFRKCAFPQWDISTILYLMKSYKIVDMYAD